ncbi:dead end protein 1-like [Phyllopteryx taeniolatus]|uniref:dead end protein 1-like n=1 Tax=Phyllopteryx taeniolatus TaxID=161469 RepID=UPI002AD36716|nr:dead end protein 1-like [Phyllopteryx taeniolatus]
MAKFAALSGWRRRSTSQASGVRRHDGTHILPVERKVPTTERLRALETWLANTNTKVTHANGQRKYGGPPEVWDGPAPGSKREVFIKHVPRDFYEDLPIPLFSSVGPLWEFRLMMNFSGQNRGLAYAKYGSADIAANAIRQLHALMLERIIVCRSIEKRRLRISYLPASFYLLSNRQALCGIVDGIESLSVMSGHGAESGTAVVVFASHHAASVAKKVLVEEFRRRFGLSISVLWLSQVGTPSDMSQHPDGFPAWTPNLPRHAANPSQAAARPSSRLRRSPLLPEEFAGAAGRPGHPESRSRRQAPAALSPSPLMFLQEICTALGIGYPQFEFFCSHARPDGFLTFTYRVNIPGAGVFPGLLIILPAPAFASTLEVVREAAAHRVLQYMEAMNLFRR